MRGNAYRCPTPPGFRVQIVLANTCSRQSYKPQVSPQSGSGGHGQCVCHWHLSHAVTTVAVVTWWDEPLRVSAASWCVLTINKMSLLARVSSTLSGTWLTDHWMPDFIRLPTLCGSPDHQSSHININKINMCGKSVISVCHKPTLSIVAFI